MVRILLSLSLAVAVWIWNSPAATAAEGVDESPLPVQIVKPFPKLKVRRPVAITHAGDGTNRIFILSQYGQILVGKVDPGLAELDTVLDIEPKVDYQDKENEEGLLGLAFHPKFKENGELYIHYTLKKPLHTAAISRLRLSKADAGQVDPNSEEELLRVPHPYWNHKGGNLAFGPDGFLYISFGDGGAANDPHGNGQNLKTMLGKLLRIDVDRRAGDKPYAIPKDNPFVGKADALPEIYAYGLRNIWGMSFDRETGLFWGADVGQNIWEEIDLIVKGGNYGWNRREGMHAFNVATAQPGPGRTPAQANKPDGREAGAKDKLIDPIWEYHHDLGKSITGGEVYRGKRVPELAGYYVYADYVSGKVWGLKYDVKAKKVVANRLIAAPKDLANPPIMCIGSDEQGELYMGDSFGNIWGFESKASAAE